MLFQLLKKALTKSVKSLYPLYNIDHILYINLEHRKDRNLSFIKTFNELGISSSNLIRIDALYTPENGAIGCLKSHIKCFDHIIKHNLEGNILICEDDIQIQERSDIVYNKMFQLFNNPIINQNWDVIMLAHNTKKYKVYINDIIKLIDSQTSSAYIIRETYVHQLLNLFQNTWKQYMKTKKWKKEYCNDQIWKQLQKKDNWYAFQRPFVIQGISYSDIEKKVVSYGV